jgi:aryl-alcohol dehydrogenase-like predicted oxidoreductase
LTGKYRADRPPPVGSRFDTERWKRGLSRFDTPRHQAILAALDGVAEETGASVAEIALAWLNQRPGVTSVVFGARTVVQLDANLKAVERKLTPEQARRLDDASAFELGYPYDFLGRMTGGKW